MLSLKDLDWKKLLVVFVFFMLISPGALLNVPAKGNERVQFLGIGLFPLTLPLQALVHSFVYTLLFVYVMPKVLKYIR